MCFVVRCERQYMVYCMFNIYATISVNCSGNLTVKNHNNRQTQKRDRVKYRYKNIAGILFCFRKRYPGGK